ncbi:zinc metalloprotease HtpX [Phytoactinopolyspora halotolerans]|uniref:Protease HtpX homolog n=1 Tax=Phytoactinopolyspora halotolerans TaxID=1981512 RepID=A0A6L9S9Q3_9ACTN|nr:zinc metalloprotease HtpX [Phytoactinopolyspora halotolerans]NEE01773.1 zinc metalloprotease HtpX [Phytoactinopolyspora halotolerans]
MARTRFAPDRGLTARMLVTMGLLAVLYVVLVGAISLLSGAWLLGVIIGLAVLWGQWYFSDKLALSAMGAREVSPAEDPQLHAIIDRLCAMADMPKPKVAVAHTDLPNAFAAGRSPDRAVVCVTDGLRRRVDERELEAVVSHELSHVAHRDVLVMTIASVVGVLAGFMTRAVLWSGMMGGRNNNNNAAIVALGVMLVAAVVYFVSFLLTRLLSRYRELAADRGGAILTGQPSALASALTKISGDMAKIPNKDLRAAEPYNAFFFYPAMTGKLDIASLFASHPPLEKRLAQLDKISVELGRE